MKTYVTTILVGIFALIVSYSCRTRDSIIDYPYQLKRCIAMVIPQGWGFFTKSARDPNYYVYKKDSSGTFKRYTINNTSIVNAFGVSRYSRRLSYESSIILNELKNAAWTEIKGVDLPNASELQTNYLFIEHAALKNFDSGQYLLCKEDIIPWAWKRNFIEENTRRDYIFIDMVNCNQQKHLQS
ncbi:MAG: SdpA family antimicrobial peptide system protein [Saprospiraceae bacterium]|nr:SdpA family antimicrobial peptide system protein [Saprospiraceae bacterium]